MCKLQQEKLCAAENYLRHLDEIRRRAISAISKKNACATKKVFLLARADPQEKRALFDEMTKQTRNAKEEIIKYIKQQETYSHTLIKLLNNASWTTEMTKIIQKAIRSQQIAGKFLVDISTKVPRDVNSLFGQFERKVKEIEQNLKKMESGVPRRGQKCYEC